MEKVQGQSIFQRTAYKTRQNTRARFLTHACVLSRSMCAIPLDHHLTTPSFQPVLYIVFYAPTFFYNHHKQRRKLCTPHNFRRRIIVFSRSSQFSDPEGRWFESSRAHHNKGAVSIRGCCSFVVLFFKTSVGVFHYGKFKNLFFLPVSMYQPGFYYCDGCCRKYFTKEEIKTLFSCWTMVNLQEKLPFPKT